MYSLILPIAFSVFVIAVTGLSYHLGRTKTDNPRVAAGIGLVLAFLPPFALIYLVILALKEDVGIV